MDHECPQCQSLHIKSLHYGRKIGGVIGLIAGIASGVVAVFSGDTVEDIFSMVASRTGVQIGSISAALLAAIREGTAGCVLGVMLGDMIDNEMLNNHKCLSCGCRFSMEKSERNEQY